MDDQFSSTQFWRPPLQQLTDEDIFGLPKCGIGDKNNRDPEDYEDDLIRMDRNQEGKMRFTHFYTDTVNLL